MCISRIEQWKANILTWESTLKKLKSVLYEDFINIFSAAASADGAALALFCSDTFISYQSCIRIHKFYLKEWFVSIVKEVCWLFGVSAQCFAYGDFNKILMSLSTV